MKQQSVLFGIFAHPDDEAFGPSAYLYRQAQAGADVHLIVATDGDAGQNAGYSDLAGTRYKEWIESGKRIGVASNYALHFPDGGLCNNLYLEIADKITKYIRETLTSYTQPVAIEFVTMEARGLTGHLDHIAMSYITTFVYERLKADLPAQCAVSRLLYYYLPQKMAPACDCSWIYMPAGREPQDEDFIHDFTDIVDAKLHIMKAHESQKEDMEKVILAHAKDASMQDVCLADHFMVYR